MSFKYALSGILSAIKNERNLRIHIVIANLIAVFARFYGISRVEWAMLIIMAFSVIAAELFNTAIEAAVDTATMEKVESAKLAKDAAAGAVLVFAIASVFVGVCIFGDLGKILITLIHIFTTPKILVPCLVLGIGDIIFLIFGGKNGKKF